MAATFYQRDNYGGVYLSGLYSIYLLLAEFSVRNLQYERVFFHRFMAQARSLRIV